MLGLMVCAIISELFQPGVITQASTSLTTREERTYKNIPDNFFGQFFITIFRVGTSAMAIQLALTKNTPFMFHTYAIICALVLILILLRIINWSFLNYVFNLSRIFTSPHEHFFNIYTLGTITIFPILLVLIYIGHVYITTWTIGLILMLFFIIWIYRSAKIFIISPKAILYYILYIITLEVLPMGLLIYLSIQTIY